jgi:lambda family phage holin
MAMMDKDPTFWAAGWSFITSLSAATKGAIMAFFIAYLRIMYDGKETRRIRTLLEALLCGSLSLCATSVIKWMSLPPDMAIAIGGAIGFVGVNTMREKIIKLVDRKIS